MKIMYCIPEFYNSGGMERVLSNKINWFKKNTEYEIIIITTDQKENISFYPLKNNYTLIDLKINYSNDRKRFFPIRIPIFLKKRKKHIELLQKIIIEKQPDIIVSMIGPELYFLPYLKLGKSKIIREHHFNKYASLFAEERKIYKLKNLFKIYKEEKIIEKYDRFIVLTEEDRIQWKNSKVQVINNSLSFYPKITSTLQNKKVISVGRLVYQKGYDLLIEIWKKVVEKYSDWILDIYGEGELRKELQEKINNYKLENNIFLRGREKNIQEKYLESSIYIMSSRYEGFGMVLVEAQACGLPIVSFDCPCGPKDIITNEEDGFLCEFGDIDDMVDKIIYLIENEEKRKIFGKKARENSLKFSEEKIMKQWKELFENLVKE
ncbi:Probable poly(glycerol-phosphate) alpha-glucosyltransferase [Fusobacterium necrogenes]|uniref:Probable poly(Glycerol-phosphate) alpha-glucosyltransferase n=1 Tax=Fusobacterium necrogenes TaxID=858 RepID=A0A377GV20_9FUSO|nr:glycosyltransferase family 4 protein [Fusobacterium necrogenes]STO30817.1 Probable poly(glycerol-phosphate) alpha-glucosyltransferase [Fusobacterium necrogenes]